jgi:hypothetical protein
MGQARLDDIDGRIRTSGAQAVVQLVAGELTAQLCMISNALFRRVPMHGPPRAHTRRGGDGRD